jgi:hypothetical protein
MKSQVYSLEEAILLGGINISLRRKDGIDIKPGNTQDQLETAKRQFEIVALGTEDIQVVVQIKGFPCETVPISISDSPGGGYGAPKFMAKHNIAQFVHT